MDRFGVSEEELKALPETLVSGGAEKVWRAWQAAISKQQDEVDAEYDAERRDQEATPLTDDRVLEDSRLWAAARDSREERRSRELEHLEAQREQQAPIWRMVSGLDRDEFALYPGERAARIRKLLRAVERMARVELRAEDARCGGDWRALRNLPASDGAAPEDVDGRCHAWDPLRTICYYMGLAKTKLGAYAWELWGLSAPQLVDRVKCETARGSIRAEMKAFVLKHGPEHPEAEEMWAAWRLNRKGLAQRTSLAARLGFSSYSRYFRACVLCYGVEPSELEREVFEEVMTEPSAVVKQSEEESPMSKVEGQTSELRDGETGDGGVREAEERT